MFARLLAVILALAGTQLAQSETLLQRGEYLVNSVMGCDGCHTTPGGPRFAGGPQTWDNAWFTVKGTNITPDNETGIGSWSDEEIKRLLIDGVRPNGVPVADQMPFMFHKVMTARDVDAVVAYIRTVTPVRREVPPPSYKQEAPVQLVPGGENPFTEDDLKDKLKRGFYLANIAHCMNCHSRGADDLLNIKGGWGKGGHIHKTPVGPVRAVNITSHPTKGIGSWTDEQIKQALKSGVRPDGSKLRPPMGPRFSGLKEEDLDALVAWVRTIPPIE